MSSGRLFQIVGPATEKAQPVMLDSLMYGTSSIFNANSRLPHSDSDIFWKVAGIPGHINYSI